ncbi:mitochondrial ornithine transporter 1-like [Antedon mediterranea]|uniref:mitochondrial ornithine transporter 1-like n=1 Tax=Antedon mediterranea TaxID=105859 RepID=UPI003AF5029F
MASAQPEQRRKIVGFYHAFADLMAGAVGGVVCAYVGQPFDTIKVKMQTYPHLYKNSLFCLKQTLNKEGIPGIYRGSLPACAAVVGETSVVFMCYGLCQKAICSLFRVDKPENLTTFQNSCAGGTAAFFSSIVLCPTELVKCRVQAMQEAYGNELGSVKKVGPWQVTKNLIKADGIGGLFQGLTSTWLREMPGFFILFGVYEFCRQRIAPAGVAKEDIGPVPTLICGGIAGTALWTLIYPIDVIKSRIQVQSMVGAMPGFGATFIKVLKTEGLPAFTSGLIPCVLRAFPANAAMFITFEWTKNHLRAIGPQ